MLPSTPGRRSALTALLLLATLGLGWSALSLRGDDGVESMIPARGEDLASLRELHDVFGSDEVVVIAVGGAYLFSAPVLQRLDELTLELAALSHVRDVLGPTTVQDVKGDELGPYRYAPYESVRAGELSAEQLGRFLGSHPLFGGLLVGRVETVPTAAAVLVELEPDVSTGSPDGDDAGRDNRAAVVSQIRKAVAGLPPDLVTHVAGIPVEKVDLAASVHRDQRILVPLILALLGVTTLALYRYAAGVVVPLGVVVVSVIWTLGFYAAIVGVLNPVTSLVTPVVLVVSVAAALHLMNHFLEARMGGMNRYEAVNRAVGQARTPCLNAALTTAFGLLSLWMLPIPAVRGFALFSALGVMISYALTMTLGPLLLLWLPDPPARMTRSLRRGRVVRALGFGMEKVVRHPVAASLAWLAILGLALTGALQLRVETDIIRSLSPESPLYRATRFIDDNLTGVNSLEILLHDLDAQDPHTLRRVDAFERELEGLEGIRKVSGLPDLVDRVRQAFVDGIPEDNEMPGGDAPLEEREELADIRWLLEEEAPDELARLLSPDGSVMRVTARVAALDSASSQRLFDEVRQAAVRHGLDDASLTGNFVIFSNMSTTLVRNQVRGVALALALILVALIVQFRSLRLGLLGLIPTAFPILMVYGLMGWIGIPLSVPTAMIACVALGMTVDGTIHLLSRLQEVFDAETGYLPALKSTLSTVGRANLFATVALSLGFCVGALSSFEPSVHFALLTGASLIFGLLCVVLLLPLLLVRFRPLGESAVGSLPGRVPTVAAVVLMSLMPLLAGGAEASGPIVLKDQYGAEHTVEARPGETVLLIYGQATGLRRMKSWEFALADPRPDDLLVVRGLDARAARGKKTEEEARARLQRSVPEEILILIDWEGELAGRYEIPSGKVSVVVITPDGMSCGALAGSATAESVERIEKILARVREAGACP